MYLNFGHTIGRTVEQTAGYGKAMHSEVVAIGMVQISRVAEKRSDAMKSHVKSFEMLSLACLWTMSHGVLRSLYTALTHDKKLVAIALRQLSFQRLVRQLSIRFL